MPHTQVVVELVLPVSVVRRRGIGARDGSVLPLRGERSLQIPSFTRPSRGCQVQENAENAAPDAHGDHALSDIVFG